MSKNLPERHFSRIPFDAETFILATDNDQKWPCTLLDISLDGALTSLPSGWDAQCGDSYQLELQLGTEHEEDLRLHMDVKVIHIEDDHVGFEVVKMGIETANHLHRLVELNIGNSETLKRELAELVSLHTSGTVH